MSDSSGNILIGEDDAVLREVYVKKFTLGGYNIRVKENGQEVLLALGEESPDVLVLDIHMPVIDGFSVLEKIPREERTYPVIMLSNFGDEKSKAKAKELGADDFFVKSEMSIKALVEMVDELMKAKRMWQGGS